MTHFVSLDFEATSQFPLSARIVQAATVRFEEVSSLSKTPAPNWQWTNRLVCGVDPQVPIPRQSTAIHGLSNHDVAGDVVTATALPMVLLQLRGEILCTFNGLEYDVPLLFAECRRHNLMQQYHETVATVRGIVDVYTLVKRQTSRRKQSGVFTLQNTVRSVLGYEHTGAHDASEDAEATGWLLVELIKRGDVPSLEELAAASRPLYRHLL